MADETATEFTPETLSNGEDNSPAIGLISQYVKDLSFENPSAPAVYQWQAAPEIDVQFNIGAESVGENLYEVVLKIDVKSKSSEGTAFVIELQYAGLFGIRSEEHTSELQSLMRISYAVFCLKTKNTSTTSKVITKTD